MDMCISTYVYICIYRDVYIYILMYTCNETYCTCVYVYIYIW